MVKDLLESLVRRGIDASGPRLFVIDGGIRIALGHRRSLRRAGAGAALPHSHAAQRARARLPERPLRTQVRSVIHEACQLSEKEGMAKLRRARRSGLPAEHPDARASLLEGLEESFTVNRLKLTPALIRCLASTNIIENPNAAVRAA